MILRAVGFTRQFSSPQSFLALSALESVSQWPSCDPLRIGVFHAKNMGDHRFDGHVSRRLFLYDLSLEPNTAGTLTLTLSEAIGLIKEADHALSEDDTLYTLLERHYDIECADASNCPE